MTAPQDRDAVDVVLPCLDEAQALPWVLARMPPGYRAIVADNGSTDGSADVARAHGATVVVVPQRGFGAACHAGLLAATADVVCFLDADASLDPQQLPLVAAPVVAGTADLVLGRRRPTTRGAWPLHGRIGNALSACWTAGRGTPWRCSPRPAPPAGGSARSTSPTPCAPAGRRSPGPRAARGTRCGTCGRCCTVSRSAPPPDAVHLLVLAKAPVAGRVKTRLCPPFTPAQAAQLAAAALRDTLAADAATPAVARTVVLDGQPGAWRTPSFGVLPQRGDGLDERLAAAFDDGWVRCPAPLLLIGMDTPQVTPALLSASAALLLSDGTDAVLGRADDGGWWALGLRRPDAALLLGVPMSTAGTGAAQDARLVAAGLRVRPLPRLRDVDTAADARAVAAGCPSTHFAAALQSMAVVA